MLAIFIPGGGYFYTRYYLIGIIDAAIELFLLVFIAFTANDFRNGVLGSLTYLALVGAIFLFVKITSAVHSSHFTQDFIPKEKKIKPMTSELPVNQAPFKP